MPLIPDLSSFRVVNNWPMFFANYPISINKLTQGSTYKNPTYDEWASRVDNYEAYGIAYHFLENYNVHYQAEHFVYEWDASKGIALDIETNPADNSNPTFDDADYWLDTVSQMTGVPRSQMIVYVNHSWYNAFGHNSHALADTILWTPEYYDPLNWIPFGGWPNVTMVQFGSNIPIAGVGNGDMSVTNDTVEHFLTRIGLKEGDNEMTPQDKTEIINGVYNKIVQAFTPFGIVPNKDAHETSPVNAMVNRIYKGTRQGSGEIQGQLSDILLLLSQLANDVSLGGNGVTLEAKPSLLTNSENPAYEGVDARHVVVESELHGVDGASEEPE